MDDRAVLELLTAADASGALPRLGGMARPDGVAIVSEQAWAFARTDGAVTTAPMPQPPAVCRRIPLLRGLVRLGATLAPLLSRRGAARGRDRAVLLAALVVPPLFGLLPHLVGEVALGVVTLGLIGWILRGRTLFLHGAEHRAIAAAEERRLVETWHGRARPSRFSARCGTNFAVLLAPLTFGLDRLWILPTEALTPVLVSLVALSLAMELWTALQRAPERVARIVLAPGLALQRLTTREPSLAETRVALRALAAALQATAGV